MSWRSKKLKSKFTMDQPRNGPLRQWESMDVKELRRIGLLCFARHKYYREYTQWLVEWEKMMEQRFALTARSDKNRGVTSSSIDFAICDGHAIYVHDSTHGRRRLLRSKARSLIFSFILEKFVVMTFRFCEVSSDRCSIALQFETLC